MPSDDDIFGGPPIDMSWADLGRLNQDGYVDTDPIGDDPRIFEDQFEMRSREKERTPPNVQAVTQVPLRTGPWSGNNQLGIEQGFSPDVNNRQTILKLDEWGFPQLWTIALGLTYEEPLAASDFFDITANIQFGIGGVTQTVEVDWKQGTVITLPLNAVNVIAQYLTPQVGRSVRTIPTSLRLRASVAHGAIQGAQPTRSFIFNNATDLVVPIPPFAKDVTLAQPAVSAGLSTFQFYTQPWNICLAGNTTTVGFSGAKYSISQCVSSIDFANQLVGGPMWLPIPPFARFLIVRDVVGNAVITGAASIIFRIGF